MGVLQDAKGQIQITLQKGETPEAATNFFKKYIDSGDFIGVEGPIMKTQRGEISILVKKLQLLSKSISPFTRKMARLTRQRRKIQKKIFGFNY